ncbi:7 transmembrane sweet-taste receptor of 3 GCPR-domain-containing protein [Chytridium lagenaria]|nr:7 transmembrane sweet-taste receptor of 3 GCPR-domain-containing protein [Chytridium lagenaria]
MAVAAAITNVLHCANLATSPQLANKVDYPTSFRTQSTAVLQAKAMLSLINYFNKTSIGVFSSSDEFGNGLTQQLQLFAPSYNVTIALVTVYDFSKSDLREDLQPFIDGQIQTIILIAAQFPVVNVMRSASQLNMLNGDYWLIGTTGWTEAMYAAASSQPLLRNITGVWQVQTPSFEDAFLLPDGSNAEAVELRKWWTNLFVSNESPVFPGVTKTFSQSYLMPLTAATAGFQFRSNCPNTTETSVANSISKFIFQTTSGNQTINMQAAGNMCTGQGLNYLEGYMSIYALNVGYMILKPTDFMQNTVKCGKLLVGMFDNYIKAGRITPQGINNRQMMSLTRNNITQLVNNANLTDVWGNRMMVDNGGDLQMEQEIWTYRWINITSRRQIVQGASVGKWWRSNNSITLNPNEPLLFLGGKNAPPPNRVIPIVQFAAKTSMRFAFDAIVAICSLFTLCLFVYMLVHQKVKIFMASSPNFLALILIGANISYVGVYLFSIYPMSSQSCIIFGWLKYLGFAVVFGALLVKTYRISVIFVNKKNKVRKMNDAVMLGYFSAFLVCWIAILVVWTVLPSQRPFLELNSVPQVAKNGTIINFFQTPHCQFNDYNYVNLGAMVLTLGGGVWLTYSVRNTPSAFNESKWIAIAIYNWVVIGIVLNAISNFAVKDPDVIFVMEALVVILTQTGVAAALFIPKVMEIMAGRGNNNDTL